MAKPKPKHDVLRKPARVSTALADWVSKEDGLPADDVAGKVRRPARLMAGLAEWVRERDARELAGAFRRIGLELIEPREDHHYVHEYYGRGAHKLRSGMEDPEFFPIATEVWGHERTYLYYNRLYAIYQAVRNVARQFPDQRLHCLEAGVYRGGSAYFIARVADLYAPDRAELVAVDTFDGHSAQDLPEGDEGAHSVAKFNATSAQDVREYLAPFPFVTVLEDRIQDVADVLAGELHLMHIDVDIYAPTHFLLELAAERLAAGGIAIVDDYGFTTCPGVKRALDEFTGSATGSFVVHALDTGQALVVRTT